MLTNDDLRAALQERYMRYRDKRAKRPKSYQTGMMGERRLGIMERERAAAAARSREADEAYQARVAQNEKERAAGREAYRKEVNDEREVRRRMGALRQKDRWRRGLGG